MRKQYYVGCKIGKWELFKASTTPTESSHGHLFNAAIGPFRTRRGAEFMRDYGQGNPHCQSVYDAEKLARLNKGA